MPAPCSAMCQPQGTPARLDVVAVAGHWLASAVTGKPWLSVTTSQCLPGEGLLFPWLQEGAGQSDGLQPCHSVPRLCCMCAAAAGPCSSCQSCCSAQELGSGAGCGTDCLGHPGLFWGLREYSLVCWHLPLCPSVLSALGELGMRLRDRGLMQAIGELWKLLGCCRSNFTFLFLSFSPPFLFPSPYRC